jgi:hypothetical protein
MTTIDDLATEQSGVPDPIAAAELLAALLDLPSVGLSIRGARVFGQGSRATVELDVSNGETLVWDTIRDMTRPASLAAEVVACTGACPQLKQAQAFRAVALVRALAEHGEVIGDNGIAANWGMDYLQAADVLDLDMNDQAQRWDAFSRLNGHPVEPWGRLVLRHTNGIQYVRSGWFLTYARTCDAIGPGALATRMQRVGWIRRGKEGRIKAVRPEFAQARSFNFWIVPNGWQDRWSPDD